MGTGRSKVQVTYTRGDLLSTYECRVTSAALDEPIVSQIYPNVNGKQNQEFVICLLRTELLEILTNLENSYDSVRVSKSNSREHLDFAKLWNFEEQKLFVLLI